VTLALSDVSKATISFITRLANTKLRTVSSSCRESIASLFLSAEPARWSRAWRYCSTTATEQLVELVDYNRRLKPGLWVASLVQNRFYASPGERHTSDRSRSSAAVVCKKMSETFRLSSNAFIFLSSKTTRSRFRRVLHKAARYPRKRGVEKPLKKASHLLRAQEDLPSVPWMEKSTGTLLKSCSGCFACLLSSFCQEKMDLLHFSNYWSDIYLCFICFLCAKLGDLCRYTAIKWWGKLFSETLRSNGVPYFPTNLYRKSAAPRSTFPEPSLERM